MACKNGRSWVAIVHRSLELVEDIRGVAELLKNMQHAIRISLLARATALKYSSTSYMYCFVAGHKGASVFHPTFFKNVPVSTVANIARFHEVPLYGK